MKATLHGMDRKPRRLIQHTHLLGGLTLVLMVAWVGCHQKPETLTDTDPTSTYTLVSIDGKPVPCKLTHEGHPMAVQSGIFIINADGTCSSKVVFSAESGEEMSREVKAAYTREGSTLTMKWEGAGMTTGAVDGDTFTMNNEGMIFSYSK